jgi:predicted HicB family RNase H-like nuclease
MGRSIAIKSVHLRFSDTVHRTAKMKAAAMGRTLSEYLAQLVMGDRIPNDFVAEAG